MAFGIAIQVDLIAPTYDYKEDVERREDGLPAGVFDPKSCPLIDDPVSIEDRCFASAMRQVEARIALGQFDHSIDSLNGTIQHGWGN